MVASAATTFTFARIVTVGDAYGGRRQTPVISPPLARVINVIVYRRGTCHHSAYYVTDRGDAIRQITTPAERTHARYNHVHTIASSAFACRVQTSVLSAKCGDF